MRLIKHGKEIITLDRNRVYPIKDRDSYFKPNGLWVSDEDDFGWRAWTTGEDWGTDSLVYEHLVELWTDANVLLIRNVEELDKFHNAFKARLGPWEHGPPRWLDWTKVYPRWQGIIITPYLWERRMDYMWYYGWDCASGCIWDLSAIRTFDVQLKQLTWKGGD